MNYSHYGLLRRRSMPPWTASSSLDSSLLFRVISLTQRENTKQTNYDHRETVHNTLHDILDVNKHALYYIKKNSKGIT